MARIVHKLTALAVTRAKRRGYLSDGGGLYLQVSATGAKSWVFRFRDAGKLREMGLGATHTVSLAEARDAALQQRKQRLAGSDPIAARKTSRAAARLEAAKAKTFEEVAELYIDEHRAGWENAKHAAQWTATLTTHAFPKLGALPVQGIDASLVHDVLAPIWSTKTETATRVRQRIEAILDYSSVRGWRTGDNPARWRGHLDKMLPAPAKVAKVQHHAALPYGEIASFMGDLRQRDAMAARALEFATLTAARTGEVLGAKWSEISLDDATWTVPAARMKAKRDHRVALSEPALAVLRPLYDLRVNDYIFIGGKHSKPLSNMALLQLLHRMERGDLTAHGFRSTFRDWAAEQTDFPSEAVEMSLAHAVGDKTEAAYRRGDLLEKRRQLMADWAKACASPAT